MWMNNKYKDILKALLEFYGNKEIINTFSGVRI